MTVTRTPPVVIERARLGYLLKEALLFLLFAYLPMAGGTFNGMIQPPLLTVNLVLVGAAGAAWLLWRGLRHRPFPATRLDAPWVGLLAAFALVTLVSTDPRRSLIALWSLLLYALVFYLVVDLLRGGLPAELLVKALLLGSLPVMIFNYLQIGLYFQSWIRLAGWSNPIPPVTLRVSAFLGHANFVAAYFNLLIPLALSRAVRARRFDRAGWIVYALMALGLVFFTSSRGGWLGTASALGVLALLAGLHFRARLRDAWRALPRKGIWVGAALALLLAAALLGARLLGWQSAHPSHGGGGFSASARSYIWAVAWDTFRARPLVGSGPFTYGTRFIAAYSVPPSMLLAHSHNLLLNSLAEGGLIQLGAVIWLGAGLALLAWRRWRARVEWSALAGVIAALVGLAVHSQFDTPQLLPVISVMMVALAGYLAADEAPASNGRAAWKPALAGGVVVLFALMAWNRWSLAPAAQGVAAAHASDWQTAAARLDSAVQSDDLLAFNHFQAGYAHGMLALDSSGALADASEARAAIFAYRRGLEIEPSYAVNYANLAQLLWATGDVQGALEAARVAANRAAGQPLFRLQFARMLEAAGDSQSARDAYRQALAASPAWAETAFFRATPLRAGVTAGWLAQQPAAPAPPVIAPADLDAALFGQPRDWNTFNALLAGRQALAFQGETQRAAAYGEQALALLEGATSYGIGTLGNSEYGTYIYYRPSIAADLLPGIPAYLLTDTQTAGLRALAADARALGNDALAARAEAALAAAP